LVAANGKASPAPGQARSGRGYLLTGAIV